MTYAGGEVFAVGPFGGDSGWYKRVGGGWSFVTPPWPAGPKPFIVDVFDLPNGHALFLVQITHAPNDYDYALIDFDGVAMSQPVVLPKAWAGYARKATRTPAGSYQILTNFVPGEPQWTLRETPAASTTFGSPSPMPLPDTLDPTNVAFTALTNGRMSVFYIDGGHLHEIHRSVGEVWSTQQDLTPQWAVGATDPVAVGARSGGVAVSVTGVSGSYTFPYYWDSPDGVTFSGGEYTSPAAELQDSTKFLAAECIGNPVLVIRRKGSIVLLKRGAPGAWVPLTSQASSYSAGGTAAVLGDGRTAFGWSYVLSDGSAYTTLLASP